MTEHNPNPRPGAFKAKAADPQPSARPRVTNPDRCDENDVMPLLMGTLLSRFGSAATVLPAGGAIRARLRIGNFHTAEIEFPARIPPVARVTMREAGVIRDFPYEEGFEGRIADFIEETARTFRYHIYPAESYRFAFDFTEPLGSFSDWRAGLDEAFPDICTGAVHFMRSDERELSFNDPNVQDDSGCRFQGFPGRFAKCAAVDQDDHTASVLEHFPDMHPIDAMQTSKNGDCRLALVVEDVALDELQGEPNEDAGEGEGEGAPRILPHQNAMGALLNSWQDVAPQWRLGWVKGGGRSAYALEVAYRPDRFEHALEGCLLLTFGSEPGKRADADAADGGELVCFCTAELEGKFGELMALDASMRKEDLPSVKLPVVEGSFGRKLMGLDQWIDSLAEGMRRVVGFLEERWGSCLEAMAGQAPDESDGKGEGALSPSAFACALGEAVMLDPRLSLDSMTVKDGAVVDAAEEFGAADIAGPDGGPVGALRAIASLSVSGAYRGFDRIPLIMNVCEGAESGVLVARFKYLPNERLWDDSDSAQTRPYPAPCESLPPYGVFASTRALLDFAADITRPRSQMLAVYRHRADDGSIDFGKVDFIGCDDWRQAADEFCDGCEPLGHRQCDSVREFKGLGLDEQEQAVASPESVKYLAVTPVRWLLSAGDPFAGDDRGERRMMTFALQRLATEPCGYRLARVNADSGGFSCKIAHPSRSQTATLFVGRGEPDAWEEHPTCWAFAKFSWPPNTFGKITLSLDLLKSTGERELGRFDAKLGWFLTALAALAGEE